MKVLLKRRFRCAILLQDVLSQNPIPSFRFINMKQSANKAKSKKLKDQDAPKRPLNPYMMFCSQEREKVQEEIGSKNMGQVNAELSKRWAALEVEVKSGFQLESNKRKEKFEEELKSYKPSDAFLKRKAEFEAKDATDSKAKKLKDKDAPKMARNAYIIFSRSSWVFGSLTFFGSQPGCPNIQNLQPCRRLSVPPHTFPSFCCFQAEIHS